MSKKKFIATVEFEVDASWFRDGDLPDAFEHFLTSECNLVHLGGDYGTHDGSEPRDEVEGVIVSAVEVADALVAASTIADVLLAAVEVPDE